MNQPPAATAVPAAEQPGPGSDVGRCTLADLIAAEAMLEELAPVLDEEPGGVMDMTAGQALRVAAWTGREINRRTARRPV